MRDRFYSKKEGAFYFVYMRAEQRVHSDIKLASFIAITEEQAEINRQAAPIYLEAQALAAKIALLSPDVARAAAPMIQDVAVSLWQKMKADPLLQQDEIKEHMIDGVLHRPVHYWSFY